IVGIQMLHLGVLKAIIRGCESNHHENSGNSHKLSKKLVFVVRILSANITKFAKPYLRYYSTQFTGCCAYAICCSTTFCWKQLGGYNKGNAVGPKVLEKLI